MTRYSSAPAASARFREDRKKREAEAEVAKLTKLRHEPITMDVAVGRYWIEVGQHHKQAEWTEFNLGRLVELVGPQKRLADIRDKDMAEIIAKRRGEGVKPATVNRTVTEILRAIFRRARENWNECFEHEPKWGKHLLPEPHERVRELSADEEEAILAALREDFHPIFLFTLATSVRLAEAVNLKWPMVDWSARVIRLTVKGGKPHTIPITSEVREILWPLQELRPPSDPMAVFTFVAERTRFGRVRGQRYPITYNGLQRRWIADRDKSGIKDFRWHDIRHTAATRTLRAGKNLRAVQRLLGHENIATTTKYAHATLDDVREAMESAAA